MLRTAVVLQSAKLLHFGEPFGHCLCSYSLSLISFAAAFLGGISCSQQDVDGGSKSNAGTLAAAGSQLGVTQLPPNDNARVQIAAMIDASHAVNSDVYHRDSDTNVSDNGTTTVSNHLFNQMSHEALMKLYLQGLQSTSDT